MGAHVDGRDDGALRAARRSAAARCAGMRHELAVASAQVKTALLLAGLQADGDDRDRRRRRRAATTPSACSRALGAPVDGRRPAPCGSSAGAPEPFELDVPGDPSSAAFFVVAAAITPGSELVIEDVALNPTRLGFVDVLRRMGADIEVDADRRAAAASRSATCACAARALHGTTIEGDEIPNVQDEIPVLAVAAAFADGVTEIRDAAELAVKESNRIGTLHQELDAARRRRSRPRADGLVDPGRHARGRRCSKSHGDHRIAMAAAVAANAIDGETTVRGLAARSRRRIPEFADDLAAAHRSA